jgi:PAS domain S-box-containing protein
MRRRRASVPTSIGPRSSWRIVVGRIAYWSAGATDLFGYTAESMVGKAVSVLVPGIVPAPPHRRVSRGVGNGRLRAARHGDDPGVFADGETRSFASHIFPIRNPHGEVGVRYAGAYQEAPPRGVLVSSSTANWYQRVERHSRTLGHSGDYPLGRRRGRSPSRDNVSKREVAWPDEYAKHRCCLGAP